MIRILVISDTHGMNSFIENVIEENKKSIHAIIHAGDYVSDADEINALFPTIPMYNVAGNNDIYSRARGEMIAKFGGVNVFITHGHSYGVKYDSDYRSLITRAQALGAQVAVFGHTHEAHLSYFGGITLLNPGTTGYLHRYAWLEIENGKANAVLVGM